MPYIAAPCSTEESDPPRQTSKPLSLPGSFYAKMDSKPAASKIPSEELRATQLRLYLLLVEAQDRLERERGLVRTFPGRRRRLSDGPSNVDGVADDASTPEDKAT